MTIIKETLEKIHAYHKVIDLTLLSVLVAFVMLGLASVPFHGDESAYLILSEDYDRVVLKGEVEKVLFTEKGSDKQNLRLTTGSVLAFTIGFLRDMTGNDDPIEKWLWGASWEENIALGKMPTPQLLNLARVGSAAMGAAGVVLFYLLALNLFSSRLSAWAATLVFATQGSLLVNMRRAMQEGPKFLFLILMALVAAQIAKDLAQGKLPWRKFFLLGIASGLTLAAKQDTAPMLVAVYLALVFIPIWKKHHTQNIFLTTLYLGAATVLAYAFFLLFMPVFWGWWETAFVLIAVSVLLFQLPHLRDGRMAQAFTLIAAAFIVTMTLLAPALWTRIHTPVASMLQLREGLVQTQLAFANNQNTREAESLRNRLPFLLESTISSNVMYFEAASFDIPTYHALIDSYESSPLSGRTGSFAADGLIFALALFGIWSLARNFSASSLLTFSMLLVTGLMLFLMIPLAWQRYYLILQIPYALIVGVGANQAWAWIRSLRQRTTAP